MSKRIVLLLAALTCFLTLGSKSYWFDEAFSIYISQDWHTLTQILWTHEANMWLYYFLLHFWLLLGKSEFIVRSLSAIFAVATIPVIYKLGETLFSKKVGLLTALLTSVNVFFILYAQEARSYSLLLLLTTLSTYFFYLFLKEGKTKTAILYIIITSLAFYAHIYAGLTLVAQFASIFFYSQKKRKRFFIAVVPLFSLIPMILAPSIHSNQISWFGKPALSSLVGTFVTLSGDFPPLAIMYGLLLASLIKVKRSWQEMYTWTLLVFPILVSFVFSLLVKPIYQSVYFIICLVPFLLLVSFALTQMRNRTIFTVFVGLILFLSAFRLWGWYSGNTISWVIKNYNEDWRNATKDVTSHFQNGDRVIFYGYFGKEPFSLYGKEPTVEISSAAYDPGGGSQLPEPNNKLISLFTYPHVWVVINRNTGDGFNRSIQWQEVVSDLDKHYQLVRTDNFYKVSVEKFTLDNL